jgi:hypothetical protein
MLSVLAPFYILHMCARLPAFWASGIPLPPPRNVCHPGIFSISLFSCVLVVTHQNVFSIHLRPSLDFHSSRQYFLASGRLLLPPTGYLSYSGPSDHMQPRSPAYCAHGVLLRHKHSSGPRTYVRAGARRPYFASLLARPVLAHAL